MIIKGFNNFVSKWFGWIVGKDFELISEDVDNIILASNENIFNIKFK